MNYNSLYEVIIAYEAAGVIQIFTPPFECDMIYARKIYFTEEALAQCPKENRPKVGPLNSNAANDGRAIFTFFVNGEEIIINDHIKNLSDNLDAIKGVWEFRTPGADAARFFGFFLAPDIFLVTHCEMRKNLSLNWDDKTWQKQIRKVEEKRRKLFPKLEIFLAERETDYLSNCRIENF